MKTNKVIYKMLPFMAFSLFIFSCNKQPSHQEQFQVKNNETINATNVKTDSIQVKTILIGGEDSENNNFNASYPHTLFDFINVKEEAFTKEFEEEFKKEAILFTGESVAKIHYGQHFELLHNNPKIISFLYERYQSSGNNYTDDITIHYFDLENKNQIESKDFFRDEDSFKEFRQKVEEATIQQFKLEIGSDTHLSKEDKDILFLNLVDMVKEGASNPKNYDAVRFSSDTTIVYFDKYQVASGSYGAITTYIPTKDIISLLDDNYTKKLNIKVAENISHTTEPQTEIKEETSALNCNEVPCVALTFDDGPSVHTQSLLDILKKEDVRATFFVLGKSAKVQKNTILRTRQEGHQIGNHSWDHKNLKNVSQSELNHQIFDTNNTVKDITGEDITVFRPPYGSYNNAVKETAQMPIILWDLDPLDWKDKNAEIVAERMSKAKANGIILAHDIHKTTVDAVPSVIKALKAKGYHLVTIDQLLGKDLEKGKVYSHK